MTNEERLDKLKQAETLIREVEFSYPQGDETRRRIYKVIVDTFSNIGGLNSVITGIKLEILAKKRRDAQEIDND